jgi:hypothetical protein
MQFAVFLFSVGSKKIPGAKRVLIPNTIKILAFAGVAVNFARGEESPLSRRGNSCHNRDTCQNIGLLVFTETTQIPLNSPLPTGDFSEPPFTKGWEGGFLILGGHPIAALNIQP